MVWGCQGGRNTHTRGVSQAPWRCDTRGGSRRPCVQCAGAVWRLWRRYHPPVRVSACAQTNSAAAPTPTKPQLTQGAGSSGVGQRNVVGGGLIAVVCGGECGVCGVHERGQRGGHICQQAASSGHLCVSVPPFTPCGLHRLLHTFTQQTASPGGGRGAAEQQGAGAERQEESGGLHVLCGGWLLAGETRRAPRGEMSVREWRLCLQRSTKRA